MALGKYQRVDSRKSSSYCSTGVVIALVALSLVGVWMMTSPSVVPERNEISLDGNAEVAEMATKTKSRQFEDSQGDLPEDAMKGDSNNNSDQQEEGNSEVQDNQKASQQTTEETTEDNQGDKSEKDNGDKGAGSDETSNAQTESNGALQKTEEAESSTESGGTQTQTGGQAEPVENPIETNKEEKVEDKVDENQEQQSENSSDNKKDSSDSSQGANEVFPDVAQAEILNETTTQNGSFSTQRAESKNEKEKHQSTESKEEDSTGYSWRVCNVTAGPDYIPCLDNVQALKKLKSTRHYEHRERHCPEEPPTCLVALPEGYKRSIEWPKSRDKIWYHNVPHTKLAAVKGHQNWVKVTGEYLTFPGGGTQFKYGASHYIDFLQEGVLDIAWGKQSRVILDVGCGVASFGGYLFDKDVLTMSLAPKDEHEAQVQFALERGIPAISAVMGTKRLPFPGNVFDAIHCARCRVPWHIEGGQLLLELNRMLRPGGYFLWSATPVYQNLPEDVEIWNAMTELTKKMCWELVTIKGDKWDGVGAAIYRKPLTNECYENRQENDPPLCKESDDPNAAWNVSLQACMHKVSVDEIARGSHWPEQWPLRLERPPYWLTSNQVGVYGKAAPEDFSSDYKHWKHVVTKSYLSGMGISWSRVRNVMDMRSIYGGFAAALKDLNVWVMNVVTIDSPDTLPIIYERGLFGMYHDWCESFSTYPRSYDLLHADHLFSKLKKRCNLVAVMAEVDRILRPEGKLIVRDNVEIINEIEKMAKSLLWEIRLTYSKDAEGLLCVQKTMWRPKEIEVIASATV